MRAGNAFEDTVGRLLQTIRLGVVAPGEALPPERRDDPDVASILAEAGSHGARNATVVRVTYRAAPDEAHPGGSFDFSPATLAERWEAGARGMREALRRLEAEPARGDRSSGLVVHDVGN